MSIPRRLATSITLTAFLVGFSGCSDDGTGSDPDSGPDAAVADAGDAGDAGDAALPDAAPDSGVIVGPLQELPLLASGDPTLPFNHSAEVTIAAENGHVVAAYINMHFDSAQTFDTTDFHKRVGVALSHDAGDTWGSGIDPNIGDQTTDPVVRVGSDGTFWLTTWDTSSFTGAIADSSDHGETWQAVVTDMSYGDKEWIAVDDARQVIWAGAVSGMWQFSYAGAELASSATGSAMVAAYVDTDGVHFGAGWPDYSVLFWDGSGAPVQEGAQLPGGALADELNASMSLGQTSNGGQWSVRAVRTLGVGNVVLRVRHLPGDEGTDLVISDPAVLAFYPAAATDATGRLHVIWYESGPTAGVLNYARSLSDDLTQGFGAALVIDPDAVPAGGWYPFLSSTEGGRRLREYIDLTVDGNRAHLVWTHAPTAPSRVYATYVEFP
jgi:hypothetical protein